MHTDSLFTFFSQYPPFAALPIEQRRQLAAAAQKVEYPPAATILAQGDQPVAHLYVVFSGSVDLLYQSNAALRVVDTLGVGEAFGYLSLLNVQPPRVTVRTREASTVVLLPAALFHELRAAFPDFGRFFSASTHERMDSALQTHHTTPLSTLFQTRLGDIASRPVVSIDPAASVRAAAQLMQQHNVSCLVVTATPRGIVTDRDLRNRVLAAGLPETTPVSQIMSTPLLALSTASLALEALTLMMRRSLHHVPVTEGGDVVGMVTQTDILRRQTLSPLFLPGQMARAVDLNELRVLTGQMAETVGALLDAGARVSDIGRVVAVIHDALLTRLLQNAEASLGPPPCPYAWLVFGSEGRYEQTLLTDQDNALAYADDTDPAAAGYFTALAEQVVEGLVACGFPRCPGDIMASNPTWRQPLEVWRNYFQDWIDRPDEEALLRVGIFFDLRQVYGLLPAEATLRPIIAGARGNGVFLGRLARAALRQRAPFGFFRQLLLEHDGNRRDLLDIKLRGTAMIVDLARLFALEAGLAETNTIARLRQAAPHSSLSTSGAEQLVAAFDLFSLFRLRHHYQQYRQGEPLTNQLPVAALSNNEQRQLKEALRIVERVQNSVELTFRVAQFG